MKDHRGRAGGRWLACEQGATQAACRRGAAGGAARRRRRYPLRQLRSPADGCAPCHVRPAAAATFLRALQPCQRCVAAASRPRHRPACAGTARASRGSADAACRLCVAPCYAAAFLHATLSPLLLPRRATLLPLPPLPLKAAPPLVAWLPRVPTALVAPPQPLCWATTQPPTCSTGPSQLSDSVPAMRTVAPRAAAAEPPPPPPLGCTRGFANAARSQQDAGGPLGGEQQVGAAHHPADKRQAVEPDPSPTLSSSRVKPRPARFLVLYLTVWPVTMGRSRPATGRGATAAALVARAAGRRAGAGSRRGVSDWRAAGPCRDGLSRPVTLHCRAARQTTPRRASKPATGATPSPLLPQQSSAPRWSLPC